jgi:predicted AlkP superfamily phosphohydrolase/phosphomutase
MPRFFGHAWDAGTFLSMHSTHPPVSGVAWASIMTGCTPGRTGVFGFADIDPATYELRILNRTDLRVPGLWRILTEAGVPSVFLNVPLTYPPEPVDGLMVTDFLSPSLDKACLDADAVAAMRRFGYVIDADASLGHRDLKAYVAHLTDVLRRRMRTYRHFVKSRRWRLFFAHVMETDRLNHFLWRAHEEAEEPWHTLFREFYRTLGEELARLVALAPDADLVVLSDHGSATLHRELYLNAWLAEEGWLEADGDAGFGHGFAKASRAFAMDSGQVFLHRRDRFAAGTVPPEAAESARADLADRLRTIVDPETDRPIVRKVWPKEAVYRGPEIPRAPDLLVEVVDGYDVRGAPPGGAYLRPSELQGRHSRDDAFLLLPDASSAKTASTKDVAPTLLRLLGLDVPEYMEGTSLI